MNSQLVPVAQLSESVNMCHLLLVGKNDPKFCAPRWTQVEKSMKVFSSRLVESPRISRNFCTPLSTRARFTFHHGKSKPMNQKNCVGQHKSNTLVSSQRNKIQFTEDRKGRKDSELLGFAIFPFDKLRTGPIFCSNNVLVPGAPGSFGSSWSNRFRVLCSHAQQLRASSPAANSALNNVIKIEQNVTLIEPDSPSQNTRTRLVNISYVYE
jgi:hypothetical protein